MTKGRWKRPVAVLTAAMLAVTAFTGCSASDRGFASLFMEASDITAYTLSGELEIVYDPEAMYYYRDEGSSPVRIQLNISGEVVSTSIFDAYLNLKIKYGINGKGTPHEADLRLYNGVAYMPAKDYVDFYVEMMRLDGASDKLCENLRAAFLKGAAEYDYVILADMSELYWFFPSFLRSYAKTDESEDGQKEARQLALNLLTEMFSGLGTGMTKPVANGYAIEITPENAVGFYDSFIKYTIKNKDSIYKGILRLQDVMQKYGGRDVAEYLYWVSGYSLDRLADDRETFDSLLDGLSRNYGDYSEWDRDYMKLLYKGSYLNASVTKQGKTYTESVDMNYRYMGDQILSLKGSFSQTANGSIKQETAPTENPVLIEDLSLLMDRIEKKLNPAKSMELSWWNRASYDYNWYVEAESGFDYYKYYYGDDYDYAYEYNYDYDDDYDDDYDYEYNYDYGGDYNYYGYEYDYRDGHDDYDYVAAWIERADGGWDWDYMDCINESGTMYLPMRQVCEWFGEEVVWDNAAKKAYVARGGQNVEMGGELRYKTLFVKVRDFEKLGYTVDYEYDSDYKEHTVTLRKN